MRSCLCILIVKFPSSPSLPGTSIHKFWSAGHAMHIMQRRSINTYVCIYIYLYIQMDNISTNKYICIYVGTRIFSLLIWLHIQSYIYIITYIYNHIYIYYDMVKICKYVMIMNVCIYIYCIYLYTCVCIYVRKYVHARVLACIGIQNLKFLKTYS